MTAVHTPLPSRRATGRRKRSFWSYLQVFVGELLITVGLLIGGYVVWQVWWTSMMVSPGVSASILAFEVEYPAGEGEPTHHTTPPPIVAPPAYGEVFGILHVPRWNFQKTPIAQGVDMEILNLGYAGHYEDTQLPGEVGNFAIAGHRRTYGEVFTDIMDLQPGDPLVVETDRAFIVFKMTGHEIVLPHESEVILPVPNHPEKIPEKRLMTLTTCHPDWGISHRYIVYSEFEYWTDKAEGTPSVIVKETPKPTPKITFKEADT